MRRFDVMRRLDYARVLITTQRLPDGVQGISYRSPDGQMGIVLQIGLSAIERATTITHEYWHLALYHKAVLSFSDSMLARQNGSIDETRVRRKTAEYYVPPRWLKRMLRRGESIEDIAKAAGTTIAVVLDAIRYYGPQPHVR